MTVNGPDVGTPAPDAVSARPKLIVSDLDGTFLSPDGTVSARNAAAVRAAEEAGIPVVFATGRPIRFLAPIRDLRRSHATVIASNGAMTYDLGTDTVLASRLIPGPLAAEAITALRAAIDKVAFGVDNGTHAAYEPAYVEQHGAGEFTAIADPHRTVVDLPDLLADGDFVKLLVVLADGDADQLTDRVRRVLGDRLTATHSSPSRPLVEVSAPGVSKAVTLAALCERLGISADQVAAFGDMPNDLEMLRWAGMPYAMGHAHPELLSCGATVIGSNTDSAVGATIENWL